MNNHIIFGHQYTSMTTTTTTYYYASMATTSSSLRHRVVIYPDGALGVLNRIE